MATDLTLALPRRIAKLDAAELERKAKDEWGKVNKFARRTVEHSVELGLLLVALRAKIGYGGWLPLLERLGITQTTAKRLIAIGEHHEFILAAMERAPDLTQQGVERLIHERQIARLPDDIPVGAEVEQLMKRAKQKRVQGQREQSSRRMLNALKLAIADLEEHVAGDPQNEEVMVAVLLLKRKAKELGVVHEQALADDTGPSKAD